MRIVVPDAVMERVLGDSFCELEAAFRDEGVARFGGPAKDQAMFTVWSLRRTSSLIAKIASGAPVPPALKKDDEKIAGEFASCALWTQFHLDCLLTCIRSDRAVQLDVLPAIIDGLRAAVNAYGLARRGLALRVSETEPLIEPYNWDEEDRELLASSMSDMATETVDD
jgi:hypothetical protein